MKETGEAGPALLRSALAELDAATNPSPPRADAIRRRSAQLKRRRRAVVAAPVAAAVVAVAVAVAPRLADSPTPSPNVSGMPEASTSSEAVPGGDPVSDAVAYDYDAACPEDNRSAGQCPLDHQGRVLWQEVVEAFEHSLTPFQLSGERTNAGGGNYTFFAHIGPTASASASPGTTDPTPDGESTRKDPPTLSIQLSVDPARAPAEPSIVVHPAYPEDFAHGEGSVTLTRADGTVMDVRFWGATPADLILADGELDIIALYQRAIELLTFGA